MNQIVIKAVFHRAPATGDARAAPAGRGQVIPARHRFRRVRGLCRRSWAVVSFLVLCPLLLLGSDFRIVDTSAGARGVLARQRQP